MYNYLQPVAPRAAGHSQIVITSRAPRGTREGLSGMDQRYSTKQLLVHRKLTRVVADLLRGQLKEYISTLTPLLRPSCVLGGYVAKNIEESVPGADRAFKELQGLYVSLASVKPFNLPRELNSPLEVESSALELTPVDYTHAAKTDAQSKAVTVTSPLKWVLSYSGFPPRRLKELFAGPTTGSEVQQFVLHTLMLHVVLAKQTGVAKILAALRFPVTTGRLPGFGELPITFVSSIVATVRPSDDVIIESTEISGMDAFEELVNVEEILNLGDLFKEKLLEIIKSHGEDVVLPGGRTKRS